MRQIKIALLTAVAVLLGSFLTIHLYPPPELNLRGVAWCVEAHYPSLKAREHNSSLSKVVIDIHSKGVTVFVKCNGT